MGISDEQYIKGGYGKYNLSREFINEAHSRTTVPGSNKVARGEAGTQLLRRKLEVQKHYERNRQR